jgi:hypothetical protein
MEYHDVKQIIQDSRELEGVSVNIGDDKGDFSFMKSRLLEIKRLIEHEPPETLLYAQLISRYNALLYILMPHLTYEQITLETLYEIDEHLILLAYLEYRNNLNKYGPYTLNIKVREHDVVALVKVTSAIFLGGPILITLQPIEIFKGNLLPQEQYKIHLGWGTIQEAATYLAFVNPPRSNETMVSSDNNWMKMIQENDTLYLRGAFGPAFWPVDSVRVGDFETRILWKSVREWLIANCSSKNA